MTGICDTCRWRCITQFPGQLCRPPFKKWSAGVCKGCKLGYDDGKRDIRAARCAMKRCCLIERKLETCTDCPEYVDCPIIQGFFAKKGYKYKKYRESLEFIRKYGYRAFLESTRSWKGAYGRLEEVE
ncbi:MAG TPA: hypothetical protein VMW63_01775 [Methanoregulaceae archaeon]|nr:hypothetical protein [Methanoregulaceae archaeon]